MNHSSASGASVCRFGMFRLADLHIIHQKAGQSNPIHSCGLPASPSASTTHAIALHSSPNSCLILVPTHCCRSKHHSYVYCTTQTDTKLASLPTRPDSRGHQGDGAVAAARGVRHHKLGPARLYYVAAHLADAPLAQAGLHTLVVVEKPVPLAALGQPALCVGWGPRDGTLCGVMDHFFFYGSGEGGNAGTLPLCLLVVSVTWGGSLLSFPCRILSWGSMPPVNPPPPPKASP